MAKKLTDKDRVLRFMQKLDGETRTAKVAKACNLKHPSARRILNELRAEGHIARGGSHGSWLSRLQMVEEGEVNEVIDAKDLDTIEGIGDDVPEEMNTNLRDEVPETPINIYKLSCQGDTVYAFGESEDDVYAQLNAAFVPDSPPGEDIPRNLVTITKVDAVPEDGDVLAVQGESTEDDGLQSDDEPVSGDIQ